MTRMRTRTRALDLSTFFRLAALTRDTFPRTFVCALGFGNSLSVMTLRSGRRLQLNT
jgi:hypothetical protein